MQNAKGTATAPREESRPRRSLFQIHLSTAIAAMFVAGCFMFANIPGSQISNPNYFSASPYGNDGTFHGWPWTAVDSNPRFQFYESVPGISCLYGMRVSAKYAALDMGIAILGIAMTSAFCEIWLRRRKKQFICALV